MKKIYLLSLTMVLLATSSHNIIKAQHFSAINAKWGYEIPVHNDSNMNQYIADMAITGNGTLFIGIAYNRTDFGTRGFLIKRSTNNGLTWQILTQYGITDSITDLEMTVGNNGTDDRVWLSIIRTNDYSQYTLELMSFDANTGNVIVDEIVREYIPNRIIDVDITSDILNPSAVSTNQYSVLMAYTIDGTVKDSLFYGLWNTGDNTAGSVIEIFVRKGSDELRKVSIAYGKSTNVNDGIIVIAGEETEYESSNYGRIYETHALSVFPSSFRPAIFLDTIIPNSYYGLKNPCVACQITNSLNSANGLTCLIMCDDEQSAGTTSTISGFYNFNIANDNDSVWQGFTFNQLGYNWQPDVLFDNVYENFLFTMIGGGNTNQISLYAVNSINLNNTSPNAWEVIGTSFANNYFLFDAQPKVRMNRNPALNMAAFIYSSHHLSTYNRMILFSAEYPLSIENKLKSNAGDIISVYPNPTSDMARITLNLEKENSVEIVITDAKGKLVHQLAKKTFPKGKAEIPIDCSKWTKQMYWIKMITKNSSTYFPLIVK